MLIFPKGDSRCGYCKGKTSCDCLCHLEDIVGGRHYRIKREQLDYKVKPVIDLDHFRT